ncbi:MAG: DUF29 domain-containing protein [Limnothrix sp. CACIAM 69d]|nr:MAG: DUF29 domain-containing protein [Limnothrix sp. CACIAM 69d]
MHPDRSTYEADFYAWTQEQVKLLESQAWDQLDRWHLIEEIAALGKQQRQELRNRLAILIGHLLKWQYQENQRSRSWLATIRVQRRDIQRLLQDSPSLKAYLAEAVQDAYENGRDLAIGETDLPEAVFPEACYYSIAQILDAEFYPEESEESK